jgi:hypothetical protein
MATKKQIHEMVTNEVAVLCTAEGVEESTVEKLMAILDSNLAPKPGGATVKLEDVYNEEDDTILCSVSGAWLPATEEYFYAEKVDGKGIVGESGVALKRLSRQAESIRKTAIKVLNATEKAIMADVLAGEMTPEDGKEALEAAKPIKPDFSSVEA